MSNLILYIHGFGSNCIKTWTQTHKLVEVDSQLSGIYHQKFFEYDTKKLGLLSTYWLPDIKSLAKILGGEIRTKYMPYNDIVLVCHSMGGLIARQLLIDINETDDIKRITRVLLFATPNKGAHIANWASTLNWFNRALIQMKPNSEFLEQLNLQWNQKEISRKVFFMCFYGSDDHIVPERDVIPGDHPYEIINRVDHSTITRPENTESDCFIFLRNNLLRPLAENPYKSMLEDAAQQRLYGEPTEALRIYDYVLALSTDSGHIEAKLQALCGRGRILHITGRIELATRVYKQALQLSRQVSGVDQLVCELWRDLAVIYADQSLIEDAQEAIARAKVLSKKVSKEYNSALIFYTEAIVDISLSKFESAFSHFREAVKYLEAKMIWKPDAHEDQLNAPEAKRAEARDVRLLANCRMRLGDLNVTVGEFETAMQEYASADCLYTLIDADHGLANTAIGRAEALLDMGKTDEARSQMINAAPIYQSHSDKLGSALCLLLEGIASIQANGKADAVRKLQSAEIDFLALENEIEAARARYWLGVCEQHLDRDLHKAIRTLKGALNQFLICKSRLGAADTKTSLAECYMEIGENAVAIKYLKEAVSEYSILKIKHKIPYSEYLLTLMNS